MATMIKDAAGTLCGRMGSGYRGEKCGMRGGEIEVRGSAGAYLGEHLCGGAAFASLGMRATFPELPIRAAQSSSAAAPICPAQR
ncbi:MAG: hypothetical protein M0Q13_06030 [Methanothrix sp.]|nr:hypothetical protein [Methanothrix sp.]